MDTNANKSKMNGTETMKNQDEQKGEKWAELIEIMNQFSDY